MKKNEREESLGTRLKGYEREFESRINLHSFIVVRLDGHKFSKFTKGFKVPFDDILSNTMQKTSEDLLEKFGATLTYKQSDEITMIFPPQFKERLKPIKYDDILTEYGMCNVEDIPEYRVFDLEDNYIGTVTADFDDEEGYGSTDYFIVDDENNLVDRCTLQLRNPQTEKKTEAMFSKYLIKEVQITNEQIFGGRVQKMVSLFAAYATMRFNIHLQDQLDLDIYGEYGNGTDTERKYWDTIKEKVGNAWFDARIYGVPSKEEAFNSVMWRWRDCSKNSKSMYAQTFCSHKSLLNKTGTEQVEFCLEQTGKDWNKVEDKYKYGVFTKKESYQKDISNMEKVQVFTDVTTVTRTRIKSFTMADLKFSEENVDLVIRKIL